MALALQGSMDKFLLIFPLPGLRLAFYRISIFADLLLSFANWLFAAALKRTSGAVNLLFSTANILLPLTKVFLCIFLKFSAWAFILKGGPPISTFFRNLFLLNKK